MPIPADIETLIQAALPIVTDLRHDLHRHPELSGQEERTARAVSGILAQHGIDHTSNFGGTHGIVADIIGTATSGNGTNRTIALRGDMDALPIAEENEVPYRSTVDGKMHACGHDGHTANLLGTALVLHELRDHFAGRVRCVFQPAEETVSGAKALVAAGVLDGVDAALALHGWPDLAVGEIGVRSGPVMASTDGWKLILHGKGGHAAYPHNTVDPIVVGASIVSALQTIVSREIAPTAPAVISVSTFHAGTARNIIAQTAELSGTVRTLDRSLRETMQERIERVIGGVCTALRATYTLTYHAGAPVTVNDAAITDLVREVGREILGNEGVIELDAPTMGAEDFAYFAERVPSMMFRLGVGCPHHLHTPRYDYGDQPLPIGMRLFTLAALRYLSAG